ELVHYTVSLPAPSKGTAGQARHRFSGKRQGGSGAGCFWHLHDKTDCRDATIPKSRIEYWEPKLRRNRERDQRNEQLLRDLGWQVCVLRECELADEEAVDDLTEISPIVER